MSYRIKIEHARGRETVTPRRWERGGPDGKDEAGEYGYTRQIPELVIEIVTVLNIEIEGEPNLHKLADAILQATRPTTEIVE